MVVVGNACRTATQVITRSAHRALPQRAREGGRPHPRPLGKGGGTRGEGGRVRGEALQEQLEQQPPALLRPAQPGGGVEPAARKNRRKKNAVIFPEGATASAEFIGKKKVWKRSSSSKAWGGATHSRREDEDYKVKPSKLSGLKDHHAVIVHPSKRFCRKLLVPVDGYGKRATWFRR